MLQRHTYVETKFMYPSQACSQLNLEMAYTRFSHYRVAPGDRIRRPEQPYWKRG